MKKVLSVFLSMVMLLSITAGVDLSASADTYSGTCDDNITWSLDSSTGVLIINGTGEIGFYDYYEPNLESFDDAGNIAPWLCSDGTKYSELIKSVVIEKGITKVGSHAFMNCPNLTDILLPTGLESIDSRAFYNTSISEITLPASLTELNSTAFQLCNNLTSIFVADGNNSYCSVDGVLFSEGMTELIQYPANKSGDIYNVSEIVSSIGFAAFQNNTNIQEIILSENVTEVYPMAFAGCTSLSDITVLNPQCNISGNDWGQTIIQTATIHGYDNSTAYNYAQTYGNNFISMGTFDCTDHNYVNGVCIVCGEKDPDYAAPTTPTQPTIPSNPVEPSQSITQPSVTQNEQSAPSVQPSTNNQVLAQSGNSASAAANASATFTASNQTATKAEAKPAGAKKVDGVWVNTKQKKAAVKKLTKAKKAFKITWKKVSGVTGYQIQYSTSKKFTKKTTKSVTVSSNKAKSPSKTIKKLKSKKTYYVRIRTYKTVKLNGKNVKVYSSWSKVKSVKTK